MFECFLASAPEHCLKYLNSVSCCVGKEIGHECWDFLMVFLHSMRPEVRKQFCLSLEL